MKYKVYVLEKMNMPFTIQFANEEFSEDLISSLEAIVKEIEQYLENVESKFSPFRKDSLVSRHKEILLSGEFFDKEYQEVYGRSLLAKSETDSIFNPFFDGEYNPTGLVKGWAIEKSFFKFIQPLLDNSVIVGGAINGAGDMQVGVKSDSDFRWNIGIEHPNKENTIIASYSVNNGAVATSGLTKRGSHIKSKNEIILEQATVVGDLLSDVDMLATTLIAADKEQLEKIILKNNLTGIGVYHNKDKIIFERGIIK